MPVSKPRIQYYKQTCLVQNLDIKGSTSKPPQTCRLLRPRVYDTDSATINVMYAYGSFPSHVSSASRTLSLVVL
eukprot:12964751-Heterocapsa_arctica.AAC.1